MFERIKGKKVIVTGSDGYIGSALSIRLVECLAEVIRVSSRYLPPKEGMTDIRADINTYDFWESIVEQADIVFHLAGNTSIYEANRKYTESLDSTVYPLQHLDFALRRVKRKPRVIFASTATIYGISDVRIISEVHDVNPITEYDIHKFFAEQQLAMSTRNGVLEGVSLRLANVYGVSSTESSKKSRGIFNAVIKQALKGESVLLYGGGNYIRDYVYIDDVVSAFLYAATTKNIKGGVFNIANGIGYTVRDAFNMVVDKIEKVTDNKVCIKNAPWPDGASRIDRRNFVASIQKFTENTGWRPHVNLDEGIQRLIDFYMKNRQ